LEESGRLSGGYISSVLPHSLPDVHKKSPDFDLRDNYGLKFSSEIPLLANIAAQKPQM